MPYVFFDDDKGFDFMLEEIGRDTFPIDYFITLMYFFDVYKEFPYLEYPVPEEMAHEVRRFLERKIHVAKYVPVFDYDTGEIKLVLNKGITTDPEEDVSEKKRSEEKLGYPPLLDDEELAEWREKLMQNKNISVL